MLDLTLPPQRQADQIRGPFEDPPLTRQQRLSGRVETSSLMRYFQNNMANEGWRMISQFRSPHSLMLFQKGNRMAVIAIEDADLETYADVWVVPLNESIDNLPRK